MTEKQFENHGTYKEGSPNKGGRVRGGRVRGGRVRVFFRFALLEPGEEPWVRVFLERRGSGFLGEEPWVRVFLEREGYS